LGSTADRDDLDLRLKDLAFSSDGSRVATASVLSGVTNASS
jgi:hypothetical protein